MLNYANLNIYCMSHSACFFLNNRPRMCYSAIDQIVTYITTKYTHTFTFSFKPSSIHWQNLFFSVFTITKLWFFSLHRLCWLNILCLHLYNCFESLICIIMLCYVMFTWVCQKMSCQSTLHEYEACSQWILVWGSGSNVCHIWMC